MDERKTFAAGAILAGLAVALGAFGAHALEARVDARALHSWETAARYQMFHGLALLATAWAMSRFGVRSAPSIAFLVGCVLFSGSLYAYALGGPRILGAITPFGGLSFMIGWAVLATSVLRSARR
ncbi:MAG: DUF423 domain-containing protein [Polyangiales bacterium]